MQFTGRALRCLPFFAVVEAFSLQGSLGLPEFRVLGPWPTVWVVPPVSNSWIITKMWVYVALNRTHNIDCYWGGAVPNLGFRRFIAQSR